MFLTNTRWSSKVQSYKKLLPPISGFHQWSMRYSSANVKQHLKGNILRGKISRHFLFPRARTRAHTHTHTHTHTRKLWFQNAAYPFLCFAEDALFHERIAHVQQKSNLLLQNCIGESLKQCYGEKWTHLCAECALVFIIQWMVWFSRLGIFAVALSWKST